MKVQVLHAAGWTISQIAEHVGYHPATVSGWLKNGGPPAKPSTPIDEQVVDERWRTRIGELLAHNASLQATSIMRIISAEGFDGSYPSLTRYLRTVRGSSRGRASGLAMPIDTAPAEEFQFDWSDCNLWAHTRQFGHEFRNVAAHRQAARSRRRHAAWFQVR